MELSTKLSKIYAELKASNLCVKHSATPADIEQFSNIINQTTPQECGLITKLHDSDNYAFKTIIKGWGDHLLIPTSSIVYNLGVADLINVVASDVFNVVPSDGFLTKKTHRGRRGSGGKKAPATQVEAPRRTVTFSGDKITILARSTTRPPPMGKGKYDKQVRAQHKTLEINPPAVSSDSKTEVTTEGFGFHIDGSWDEA